MAVTLVVDEIVALTLATHCHKNDDLDLLIKIGSQETLTKIQALLKSPLPLDNEGHH